MGLSATEYRKLTPWWVDVDGQKKLIDEVVANVSNLRRRQLRELLVLSVWSAERLWMENKFDRAECFFKLARACHNVLVAQSPRLLRDVY
jgi:hypothetical protein